MPMKPTLASLAITLAIALVPGRSAGSADTQYEMDNSKTFHGLVQEGYEVKGTLPDGTIYLQKAKSVFRCYENGPEPVRFHCARLTEPTTVSR